MNADRSSPLAPWLQTLICVGATAFLTFVASRVMFSTFMYYDDEGYVLMSLRNFVSHGGLYRDVYSQYGPFPFGFWLALTQLGVSIDHTTGRILTLVAWMIASLSSAVAVRAATKSLPAALCVLAGSFAYLWVMASEPTHPGGLITLTVSLMAALGFHALRRQKYAHWAVIAGIGAGTLVLTKINVGGFAVLSTLAWIIVHHRSEWVRKAAPWLLGAGILIVPLALMARALDDRSISTFFGIYVAAGLAATLALARRSVPLVGWDTLVRVAGGGLLLTVAIVAVMATHGSDLKDLLQGVVLGPLRASAVFNLPYRWPTGATVFAVLSLGACISALRLSRRYAVQIDHAVALLRIGAGMGLVWSLLNFPAFPPGRIVISFGAPCLWLFFWRLPGEDGATKAATNWIALLLFGQYLHIYPVAGSQVAWATFLALPVAAIGVAEASRHLGVSERFSHVWQGAGKSFPAILSLLAVLIGWRFATLGNRYRDGSDLHLPGVEFLRLPTATTALFRMLTVNAAVHSDVLFSEPGMFSLNLWSGAPTPTYANVTHWFTLLDENRQNAIIRELDRHPRAAVVIQRSHLQLLGRLGVKITGPLHDYLGRNFTSAFSLDDFEFCVRRGRQIAPFLRGELLQAAQPEAAGKASGLLQLRLLGPLSGKVTQVEVSTPGAPWILNATNTDVDVTPLDVEGRPAAATSREAWPLKVEGPILLQFHFDQTSAPQVIASGLIVLRDEQGEELALARMGN